MTSFDTLRKAMNIAGNTRNCERWTAEEWIRLAVAYSQASHDKTPDEWTPDQIREALRSANPLAPRWDEDDDGNTVPVPGKPVVR